MAFIKKIIIKKELKIVKTDPPYEDVTAAIFLKKFSTIQANKITLISDAMQSSVLSALSEKRPIELIERIVDNPVLSSNREFLELSEINWKQK